MTYSNARPPSLYQPPATTEAVAKLDPFYMLDAPDLSIKSEPYKQTYQEPEPPAYQPLAEDPPAPPPTYGAYQEYKIPETDPIPASSAPPTFTLGTLVVASSFASPTTAPSSNPPSTTLKYGDFELYLPSTAYQPQAEYSQVLAETPSTPIFSSTTSTHDDSSSHDQSDTEHYVDWPPIYYNTIVAKRLKDDTKDKFL